MQEVAASTARQRTLDRGAAGSRVLVCVWLHGDVYVKSSNALTRSFVRKIWSAAVWMFKSPSAHGCAGLGRRLAGESLREGCEACSESYAPRVEAQAGSQSLV